jgi:hypothetical protein
MTVKKFPHIEGHRRPPSAHRPLAELLVIGALAGAALVAAEALAPYVAGIVLVLR